MKKIILFLISILSFSLLFDNKTYAQTYPDITVKATFKDVYLKRETTYSYEYTVLYRVPNEVFSGMDIGDYYFITTSDILLHKGINIYANSYEIWYEYSEPIEPYTVIYLRVTLLRSFVEKNYSKDPKSSNYIANFFRDASALYISYIGGDDYDRGYKDGYDDGKQDGYKEGYKVGYEEGEENGLKQGYQNGYNKALYEKFMSNIHVWIVPAIIIVLVIGIFVSYRKSNRNYY